MLGWAYADHRGGNALFCLKRGVDGVEVMRSGLFVVGKYSGGRMGCI